METCPKLTTLFLRLRAGDPSAREEVLRRAERQLRRMASRMFRQYPKLKRWEETDDLVQKVFLRLDRALRELPVGSLPQLLALAAKHIRWELLDLVKYYYGPERPGTRHATPGRDFSPDEVTRADRKSGRCDPAESVTLAEFHQAVEGLPDEFRILFDLLLYQELTQSEAALVLGVSESTVKRRWRAARLALAESMGLGSVD